MLNQQIKDVFFFVTRLVTRGLVPVYRIAYSGKKGLLVNLGSGADLAEGYINIDGNPLRRGALYLDLRESLKNSLLMRKSRHSSNGAAA